MQKYILSFGTCYLDINCRNFNFKESLQIQTETVGSDYELSLGGSALNFARICSNLNLPVIFIGKIGSDITGEIIKNLLKKTKIKSELIRSNYVQTNIAVHYIRSDGRSIMTSCGSANKNLLPNEVIHLIKKNLDKIKYLYLGGCFKLKKFLPVYKKIINLVKNKRIKIVVDHGRINNQVSREDMVIVKEIVKLSDFYLPSYDEFIQLWGVSSITDGLVKIRKISSTKIVVKNSENDVIGMEGKNLIRIPPFLIRPKNTVGAGDSFNAGFIKGIELGLSFDKAILFGCATAALKVTTDRLPTIDDVNKFLVKNNKNLL
jgi:sugar/nucleoside kinase (ribokinase family)